VTTTGYTPFDLKRN